MIGPLSLSQSTLPGPAVLTYSASDNSGLAPDCTPPSGSTVNLVSGPNTITVTCTDAAGNATTATASIVVSGGGGGGFSVSITSGPSGTIVAPIATFSYVSSDALTAPTPCDPGVVCVQVITTKVTLSCTLDNGTPFSCPTSTNYGGSYTTPSLQAGPHTFCVRGTRLADGATSVDCRSFTYVPEPPPVPQCTVNGSTVVCTFTLPAGTTATCAIDGQAATGCTSGWMRSGLPAGAHPLQICFVNASGVSCWNTVVNVVLATITITSPTNGSTTTGTSSTLNYTTTGFAGAPTCDRTSGSSVPLVLGLNNITVTCNDSNGSFANASVSVTRQALPGFAPTFAQTYPGDGQGATSGLTISLNNPTGSNPIRTAVVTEPTPLQPNYAAFGTSADQCPGSAIANTSPPTFIRANCPAAARVGTVTLSSPDYPADLHGDVYVVQRSGFPSLGVDFANPALGNPSGVTLPRIVLTSSMQQADPNCTPENSPTGWCPLGIRFTITGMPDVSALESTFVIDGPDRPSTVNGTLSGKLFRWDVEACDTVTGKAEVTSVNNEPATLFTPMTLPVC